MYLPRGNQYTLETMHINTLIICRGTANPILGPLTQRSFIMEWKQGILLAECLVPMLANNARILFLKWKKKKKQKPNPHTLSGRNGGKEMIRKDSEGRLNLS